MACTCSLANICSVGISFISPSADKKSLCSIFAVQLILTLSSFNVLFSRDILLSAQGEPLVASEGEEPHPPNELITAPGTVSSLTCPSSQILLTLRRPLRQYVDIRCRIRFRLFDVPKAEGILIDDVITGGLQFAEKIPECRANEIASPVWKNAPAETAR